MSVYRLSQHNLYDKSDQTGKIICEESFQAKPPSYSLIKLLCPHDGR